NSSDIENIDSNSIYEFQYLKTTKMNDIEEGISLSEENIDIDENIQQKINDDINGDCNEFEILYLNPIRNKEKILLEEIEKFSIQLYGTYEIRVKGIPYLLKNKPKFPAINEKNLINIEKARSTIYQNENKDEEFLTILVYNSKFENNFDKALEDIYGKGCINPKIPRTDFVAVNEKKIINLLKDSIYDNYAISKNIHDKRDKFLWFMKTKKVKNAEDIEIYFSEFFS
ncbi:2794_t:CDS:2, partial [Dentiscutata heterogama]